MSSIIYSNDKFVSRIEGTGFSLPAIPSCSTYSDPYPALYSMTPIIPDLQHLIYDTADMYNALDPSKITITTQSGVYYIEANCSAFTFSGLSDFDCNLTILKN